MEGLARKIRVQMVGRFLPNFRKSGNATYAMGMLTYLKERGFDLEYLVLTDTPGGRNPWYLIPRELRRVARVRAINNVGIGPFLIRRAGLSTWALALLAPIYRRLGIIRTAYRTIRDTAGWKPLETPSAAEEPQWDCPPDEREISFVRDSVASYRPHTLMICYAYMTPIFDALPEAAGITKVVITVDVLHQRRQSFKDAGLEGRFMNWTEQTESEMLRNNDLIVAIQSEDAEAFKRMAPDRPLLIAGHGIAARRRQGPAALGRSLFVGGAGAQNLQGLEWFLNKVWPKVMASLPEASLHVCGGVCDMIAESRPGVFFRGRLKSLDAEYDAAEVCVIPLLAGSGLKIKLIEALSHGLACVTTPVGAQGIPGLSDCAVVTNDPEAFANAVIEFLKNSSRRLEFEEKAHRFATDHFSPDAVFGPLADFIRNNARTQ
jgi:glycosyltransferase involved in cell wall biosynthesis